MAVDQNLAERLRETLAPVSAREVKMFGGLSFLVNEKMVVSVHGQGGLLVRCDPSHIGQLLRRNGASRAEMRGRPMKEGWVGNECLGVIKVCVLHGGVDGHLHRLGAQLRGSLSPQLPEGSHAWSVIGSTPVSGTYTSLADFDERASKVIRGQLARPLVGSVVDVLADGDHVILR